MPQVAPVRLGRALLAFAGAYIVVTILGVALSFVCSALIHAPQTAEPMQNPGYLLSEKFLPVVNLLVWVLFCRFYFGSTPTSRAAALSLGGLWLAVAVVVDYLCFVLIKNPISLSPYDFYVGQFPWIYLIYLAVFASPLCYVAIVNGHQRTELA